MKFEPSEMFAKSLDAQDPLAWCREKFHLPTTSDGTPFHYFAGNSLGLQPRSTRESINQELDDWAALGVEGHFKARQPWFPYHECVTEPMARIVGAKPTEVVVMNTLTVNLHLMMVSFYRPEGRRRKILMEAGAFPSDQYAVASQVRFHGFDPKEAILEWKPRASESSLREEDLFEILSKQGEEIALVLLGNVNYLTGQAFDIATITKKAQSQGCTVGVDLAHGAGNLALQLHDWNVDFAVWCTYKYLNAGPGGLAGCFVHERYANRPDLPRFAGWWGHNKSTRFQMGPDFDLIPGAEGWQLSNPPIFQLAALKASLEIFDAATIPELRKKSDLMTSYLEFLLKEKLSSACTIVTPPAPARGCQLSLRFQGDIRKRLDRLAKQHIICDFREPDIIRVAPVPLYTTFLDLYRLSEALLG